MLRLSDDLLYCVPWKSNFIKIVGNKRLTVCVSDIVYGNAEHPLTQFHLGVFCKNELASVEDVMGYAVSRETALQSLVRLETQIRTKIRKQIFWDPAQPDGHAIKIWYYNKNGNGAAAPFSCLRMAVTMNGVAPFAPEQALAVKKSLEECLTSWICFLQT